MTGNFSGWAGDLMAPDRVREATDFCEPTGCILLLKGAPTIITDGWNIYLSTVGNPGMATGGSRRASGDRVAARQGVMPLEAAVCAAWLQWLGGRSAAGRDRRAAWRPATLLTRLPRLLRMSGGRFCTAKIPSLLLASAPGRSMAGCAEDSRCSARLIFGRRCCKRRLRLAEVTADYGEQVYRFTMDCTWSPDGRAALTLTAPQTLEGIGRRSPQTRRTRRL